MNKFEQFMNAVTSPEARLIEFQEFAIEAFETAPDGLKMFPVTREEQNGPGMLVDEIPDDFIWGFIKIRPGEWEIWECHPEHTQFPGWSINCGKRFERECIDFIRKWMEDCAPDAAKRYFPRTIQ